MMIAKEIRSATRVFLPPIPSTSDPAYCLFFLLNLALFFLRFPSSNAPVECRYWLSRYFQGTRWTIFWNTWAITLSAFLDKLYYAKCPFNSGVKWWIQVWSIETARHSSQNHWHLVVFGRLWAIKFPCFFHNSKISAFFCNSSYLFGIIYHLSQSSRLRITLINVKL